YLEELDPLGVPRPHHLQLPLCRRPGSQRHSRAEATPAQPARCFDGDRSRGSSGLGLRSVGRGRRRAMTRAVLRSFLVVAGLGLALLACGYKPESKADLLTDSGFKVLSLNTPAKVASFKK